MDSDAQSASHHPPRRPARKRATRLIWILILAVSGYWAFGFVVQRAILFPRYAALSAPSIPQGLNAQRIELEASFGKIIAWWVPPPNATQSPDDDPASPSNRRPLVIHAHGNAETIDTALHALEQFRELGFGLLAVEYPGYGDAPGRPSQRAIVETFEHFARWAVEQPLVDPDRIVYYGFSLGGAAVIQLAARQPPAAMIVESAFTSVPAIAARALFPRFLIRDPFDSLRLAPEIDLPVLVLVAVDDETIPASHGRRLADAFPQATLVEVPGFHGHAGGHPQIRQAINEFLREHLRLR